MDYYQILEKLTPLRQKQLKTGVFVNLIESVENLSTFSKYEREMLSSEFDLTPFTVKNEQVSKDGSVKWLLETKDKRCIETVLMRFKDGRNTVCVSSQVGCPAKCAFCATGKLGFVRNLTAWEIVSQVLLVAKYLKNNQGTAILLSSTSYGSASNNRSDSNIQDSIINNHITNVVFMGMGEPLLNLENVVRSIRELNDPDGFNLGRRHMTLSTSGPIVQLKKFIAESLGVTLAISLHAPDQKLREELMPIAKANPLEQLFSVLDDFVSSTNKRVSFEYLMLDGVNDSERQARELAALLKNRLAFVNLIAFNDIGLSEFKPSRKENIAKFKNILEQNGVPTTVRVSLGEEIAAACGQLAGKQ